MRNCPSCHSNEVKFAALFGAACRTTSRCSACGIGLRFTWISGLFAALAWLAAFWVAVTFKSIVIGVIVGVALWMSTIFTPLAVDENDPIAVRRKLRDSLRQSR